jgi:hypothetical protein
MLFSYKSISKDGAICRNLVTGELMHFHTLTAPIAQTRASKVNGKLKFNSPRTILLSELKAYINARHTEGLVLPLVAELQDGKIINVWSGNEDRYDQVLNHILRDNGISVYDSKKDAVTVYKISSERPGSKRSKADKGSRFVERDDEKMPMTADELQEFYAITTPDTFLKRELRSMKKWYDPINPDPADKARYEWLVSRVENPVSEEESINRARILATLNFKVVYKTPSCQNGGLLPSDYSSTDKENNDIRKEIIQAVKTGFGEWTPLDDITPVDMTRDEMMSVIESVKTALLFGFEGNKSLYIKLVGAVDTYYSSSQTLFEFDEDELVAKSAKSVETCNNFTEVPDKTSFYKGINSNSGKKGRF